MSRQSSSLTVLCVGVALKRPALKEAPCGAEGVAVDELCLGQVHTLGWWNMHALLD